MIENPPAPRPEREPITEAEARRIGHAAYQIDKLRNIVGAGPQNGQLTVRTDNRGAASLELTQPAIEAVLALLIEREAVLLSSFGVMLEKPSQ